MQCITFDRSIEASRVLRICIAMATGDSLQETEREIRQIRESDDTAWRSLWTGECGRMGTMGKKGRCYEGGKKRPEGKERSRQSEDLVFGSSPWSAHERGPIQSHYLFWISRPTRLSL